MADTVGSQGLIDLIHRLAGVPAPLSGSLGLSTADVPPPAVQNQPYYDPLQALIGTPEPTNRTDIDISRYPQTPIPPTPTTSPNLKGVKNLREIKLSETVKPPEDPGHIFLPTTDKNGNPVTVFSTTPKLKSVEDLAGALSQYNKSITPDNPKGYSPEGYLIIPTPSGQEQIRRVFEEINQPVQQQARNIAALPNIPQPSITSSPGLAVASRVVNPLLSAIRTVVPEVAESVNTLGKAGAAAGTALAAPFMLPAQSLGWLPKAIPTAKNVLLAGTMGTAGATAAGMAGGESFDPGKAAIEFGITGLGGGLSSVISHYLTKFATGDIGKKVASEVVDTMVKRYPDLLNNPRALDILATGNPQFIESITTQMSKALMGGVEAGADVLSNTVKSLLPRALSKGEQNTFRAHMRAITEAQTNQLNDIGDQQAFIAGQVKVKEAFDGLTKFLTDKMPTIKTASSSSLQGTGLPELRIQSAVMDQLNHYTEGAQVLYYLRQSGIQSGWNPKAFFDATRGVAGDTPGNMLDQISTILRQGQPLSNIPVTGQAAPGDELIRKGWNLIADRAGLWGLLKAAPMKGPSVPWGPGQQNLSTKIPAQTLQNFGAMETGQNALRSFRESK